MNKLTSSVLIFWLQKTANQYLISLLLIVLTSVFCHFVTDAIGYRVVALILLLEVSFLAMVFSILPTLATAVLSALVWNFFFIPPTYKFVIESAEDTLLFIMYFAVALINAVLTFKVRQLEKQAQDKEGRERTIRLYNTMLNSLSHELRTPISTIIGSVDTIKGNADRLSEADRSELINEIELAGLRLNSQVGNLLDMSRLEAGVLQPKNDWCDLNELVHKVVVDIRATWPERTVQFESNDDLSLFKTDHGLVAQTVHNLLQNAVQHTPPTATMKIEAHGTSEGFSIVIIDNGPGFPEEHIISAFDKFYRLPEAASGGIGLGLSIVKGFVEVLGGSVKLENVPTGGARFTIGIPAETSKMNKLEHE
ncbi:MAG: DUF4118 domain-containing protein [Flavobacteriales bacterium]|nr:DUF4118 domain-containing protein [Flavobacteriales bacterium]